MSENLGKHWLIVLDLAMPDQGFLRSCLLDHGPRGCLLLSAFIFLAGPGVLALGLSAPLRVPAEL